MKYDNSLDRLDHKALETDDKFQSGIYCLHFILILVEKDLSGHENRIKKLENELKMLKITGGGSA